MIVTRRGISMLELIVAVTLLAALMVAALQMLRVTHAQRGAAAARQTALLEVTNLMERLAAKPWDELTEQGVADVDVSESARRRLPGADVDVEITHPADQPGAKRVVVSLRWQDAGGDLHRPVQLVAWRYPEIPQGG